MFFVENVFVVSNLIPFSGSHVLFGKSCLDSQHNLMAWENAKTLSFVPEMKFRNEIRIKLKVALWKDPNPPCFQIKIISCESKII